MVGRGYHLGRRLVVSSYHLGSRGRSPRLSSWSVGRLIETIVSVRVSGHQGYHLGHWVGSTNLSSWGVGRVAKATASVSWPLCQNCRCILLIQSPKLSSWLAGGGPRLSPWPEARRINYYLGSRGWSPRLSPWLVGRGLSLSLVAGSGHGITMVRSTLVGSPIKELGCSGSVRWEEPTSLGRRKILWSGQHPGWVMAASGWSDNIVIWSGDRIATSISWYKVDSEKSRKRLSRCAGMESAADRPSESEKQKVERNCSGK